MSATSPDPFSNQWRLDKRVPIAIIITLAVTLLVQFGTFVYWVARVDAETASTREKNATQDAEIQARVRVETMSAQWQAVQNALNEITRRMSRVEEKLDDIRPPG